MPTDADYRAHVITYSKNQTSTDTVGQHLHAVTDTKGNTFHVHRHCPEGNIFKTNIVSRPT